MKDSTGITGNLSTISLSAKRPLDHDSNNHCFMKPCAPKPLCLPAIYLLLVMVCEAWGESASTLTASSPTWSGDLEPILNDHCVKCHGPLKKKGDLDLSTFHGLIRGVNPEPLFAQASPNPASFIRSFCRRAILTCPRKNKSTQAPSKPLVHGSAK